MDWNRLTIALLCVGFGLYSCYDVLAKLYGGNGSTISEEFHNEGVRAPYLILAFGIFVGHCFFPKHAIISSWPEMIRAFLLLLAGICIGHVFVPQHSTP